MLYKCIQTIGLLLIFFNPFFSQIEFEGKVTFKDNGVYNASVSLEGSTCAKFTNDDGSFKFSCDKPESEPFALLIHFHKFKTVRVEFNSYKEATENRVLIKYKSKKKYTIEKVKH